MKKKLVSLLSLILAVVMVFPVGVFATETEGDGIANQEVLPDFVIKMDGKDVGDTIELFTNSTKNSATLSVPAEYTNVVWTSSDPDVAKVDPLTGVVTAVAASENTVTITARDASEDKEDTCKVAVAARSYTFKSMDDSKVKKEYIMGQKFDTSKLSVVVTYNDTGDVTLDKFTLKDDVSLEMGDTEVWVVAENGYEVKIEGITVTAKEVTKVEVVDANKNYTEGDKLSGIKLKVTYNDGSSIEMTSGFSVSIDRELKASDNNATVTVSYEGHSATFTIKVEVKPEETEKPSTTPTTKTYSARIKSGTPKTSYKVGESLDISNLTIGIYENDIALKKTIEGSAIVHNVTFTQIETNRTVILNFQYDVNNDNVKEDYSITITGINVAAAAAAKDDTKIKEVTSVTLKEDAYSEGYEFTLADIDKIKVKFLGDSTSTTIEYEEFDSYSFTSGLELEVFNSSGNRKTSSTYRDTIRSEDIYTDDDEKLVNMALSYKYYTSSTGSVKTGYYEFTIELSEADVAYYYKTKYITEYDDLEDALGYCNEQDDDIEDIFDFSDVDEDEYLMLKLGKSFSLGSSYEFTPENNIVIDLNGNNLSLYTDTFEFDDDEDFAITVKNTAETDAKLTYRDKDIEIILKKGDSVVFEEGKDVPGIYTVTVTYDSDMGTVTADPKLTSGKVEIGKGSEIKFTITPKKGYEINTVKAADKSVVTDKNNYSVDEDGVAVYTLKNVSKNTTFEVTFKAQKKEWNNPFSDVKSTAAYYSAVEFVYENELFKGTTTTTFSPNSTMTRAMFVTVLGRLSGMDDNEAVRKYGYDSDFTDVSSSNSRIKYAVPYIKWAVDNGIVEGYGDGTFGPENEITHQQMYVMMYRYARFVENKTGSIGNVSLSMSDRSSVADWASDAVKYAQYNNYLVYTNTTKTRIDPTGDALRSELAMLLESFCQTVMGWSAE